MNRIVIGFCLLLVAQCGVAAADRLEENTLKEVAAVRKLSRAASAAGQPVCLQATVTHSDPGWSLLFIRDASAGIFVVVNSGTYPTNGELIEVVGKTADGSFSPVIALSSWRHLGAGTMLQPRPLIGSGHSIGTFDCEWVEMTGVVQQASLTSERDHVQLEVSTGAWRARVFVPWAGTNESPGVLDLIDARISLVGVCGVDYSEEPGGLSIKVFVPAATPIRTIEPPPIRPFEAPFETLATVRNWGNREDPPGHRVHVRGVVTYTEESGEFFVIQQNESGIRVRPAIRQALKVGDRVEVLGFVRHESFSISLDNASIRPSEGTFPAQAIAVPTGKVLWGDYDSRLINLAGTVQSYTPIPTNHLITLLEDGILFGVSCPSTNLEWADLKPGQRVSVTGVCQVQGVHRGAPQSFQVLLRQSNDLHTLPAARMFSARQVLTILTITGALAALALLWGVTLKRKVAAQTGELANSLSLLTATLESTAEGVLVVDSTGCIASYNSIFAKMWGVPPELLACKNDARLLAFVRGSLKDSAGFFEKIQQLYSNPEAESFDIIELVDGRIFERFSQPQRLEGKCVGRVWCFRDVTARKRVEAELAYERDLLTILLATVPDSVYFKDRQSRFVRFSSSCAKTFGLSNAQSVYGKTDFDRFTDDCARCAFEQEQEIIRTGNPLIGKLERELHLTGDTRWSLISKLPWRDKDGQIVGIFGVATDVTSLKEAEAKFEAAQEQLIEASRRAGMAEVATSVLHNVGNVLNSLNVSAGMVDDRLKRSRANALGPAVELIQQNMTDLEAFLKQDPKGQRFREYLKELSAALLRENETITEEILSLRKNVEHIKTIVAMQQTHARVTATLEWIDPRDLMETAAQISSGAFHSDAIQLVRQYQSMAPVLLDRHRVLQILVNLLSNARQALNSLPESERRVVLSVSNQAECVYLGVADNGKGIDPLHLDRIFTKGFTTKADGHGFGLHSSAKAANEMSATLSVQSDGIGKGAAFTLQLPKRADPTPPTGRG